MGVKSSRLYELGIVDQTIPEPLGGAHRDMKGIADRLKTELLGQVDRLNRMDMDELLERRYRRLMSHGAQRAR
jgi:acetyl-CoA carboxylase carboxyl transferase subunit alpha